MLPERCGHISMRSLFPIKLLLKELNGLQQCGGLTTITCFRKTNQLYDKAFKVCS